MYMKSPNGIVRALLKTTLTGHLWASFFCLFLVSIFSYYFGSPVSLHLLPILLLKTAPHTLLFLVETGCYAIHGAHPALSSRLQFSLFAYYINLLEWEFCWYNDATADHPGERIWQLSWGWHGARFPGQCANLWFLGKARCHRYDAINDSFSPAF